jgi:hypothetical protein
MEGLISEQIKKYWEEKLKKDSGENERVPGLGGFDLKKMLKLQMMLN